jgi:WH1 domain
MPSPLNKDDKTVVKRAVPSSSNNIIAVAVARLYVNYPNKHKWNFTGISGAVVLAEDLVGHTFFFKIVDVTVYLFFLSPSLLLFDRAAVLIRTAEQPRRHMGPGAL